MGENIFETKEDFGYREQRGEPNLSEFHTVLKGRRSVRIFSKEKMPENIVESILDDGMLAPNSSNLQPWEFYWVRDGARKEKLAEICFNQNGAKTASDLIVCIARTDTWKKNAKDLLNEMGKKEKLPKTVTSYYKKIVPYAYGMVGVLSPFKWVLITFLGLFKLVPREPIWSSQMKTWAVKTTALACENIMLSARAHGYDSLPMEGYDGKKLKSFLGLSKHQHLVMVIALGKAAENGIYGPQIRLDKEKFIRKL